MIIIAENKKNHYLLKNFFKEISKVRINESLRQDQAGEHTALDIEKLDLNDTVVDQSPINTKIVTDGKETNLDEDELKRAAYIKPKMNKLLNLFKKGLKISAIAAAMFFSSDNDNEKIQALSKIADDNNVEIEKVIEYPENKQVTDSSISLEDNFNDTKLELTDNEKSLEAARIEREYDGEGIDYNTHPNSIYNFEGFRSKPYEDAGGMSIGYGTQIFTRYSDSRKTKWQKVFFEEKLGSRKLKNKNLVIRNGRKVKASTISSITREEARKAADIDIKERVAKMLRIYPWLSQLPRDAQLGFLDMTYNMGLYFNMSGFKANMKAAAHQVSIGDFDMAIRYLETAKEELKYFKTPGQISYENSGEELKYSGYAVQGEKSVPASQAEIHRRPQNTLNRIDNAISVLQSHIDKRTEKIKENFSVKNVYKHLYS